MNTQEKEKQNQYIKKLRSKIYESLSQSTGMTERRLKNFLSGTNNLKSVEWLRLASIFGFDFDSLSIQ